MRPGQPRSFFVFVALLLSFAVACEREAALDVGPVASKLVITSYISPQDTALVAFVGKSLPLTGAGDQASFEVKDAQVELSDGTAAVTLLYTNGYYTAPAKALPILPGQTYFLRVTTPGGLEAGASCTVPAGQIEIGRVVLDSVVTPDQQQYSVAFEWADPVGEKNYYEMAMQVNYRYRLQQLNVNGTGTAPADFTQPPFAEESSPDGGDLRSPPGQFTLREKAYRLEFWLNLLHEDVHMHTYRLGNHYTRDQGDGSLFVTPRNLYSNVTGGLGVFGAYTRTTKRIRLR